MPVKIRLRRMGRKKQPHFRVVVADGRSPRDGRFVETIGYYKPLSDPARLVLDLARVDHWLGEGASPSDTVKSLIAKARKGGTADLAVGEVDAEERKAKKAEALAAKRASEQKAAAKKAEKPAAEPAAEAAAEAPAE
jgi:small subunit ribosomal protein S16